MPLIRKPRISELPKQWIVNLFKFLISMKLNSKSFLFLFIRVLLGTIFILSAIFKLISIDTFELYIFSLKWFSFNVAAVLARLVISVELLLGILLITNIKYNIVWRTTVTLLTLFSLFFLSGYKRWKRKLPLFWRNAPLVATGISYKNIIMLGLLFLIRKEHSYQLKYRSNILLFSFVFCFTLPLVISRPDFLINWEDPSGYTMETISARIHDSETLNNLKVGENKKCFACSALPANIVYMRPTKFHLFRINTT